MPCQLISDLNGDGEINGKDGSLKVSGQVIGASDDAKTKGTEFLFPDDDISNGIWDKDDTNAPSGTIEDDDAKEIRTATGATSGAIWFEHPGIEHLAFYKTRACDPADILTFPFLPTPTNRFPPKLFVRATGTMTEEIEGDLEMHIGKADESQTFTKDKLPLTLVPGFGTPKFFQAADRYILQNNSLHCRKDKTYLIGSPTETVHVVVRREVNSTIQAVDAYHSGATNRAPILRGIRAVAGVDGYPNVDQIINGNLCGTYVGELYQGKISTISDGRLIQAGSLNAYRNMAESGAGPAGSDGRFVAMGDLHVFTFGRNVVPTTSGYSEAMGGLLHTTTLGDGYITTFIGEVPVDSLHKVLFTVSYDNYATSGNHNLAIIDDARTSGCPPLLGGDTNELTLFFNDGSTSIALALKDAPSAATKILVEGSKHNNTLGYYIHTYLILTSDKPDLNRP